MTRRLPLDALELEDYGGGSADVSNARRGWSTRRGLRLRLRSGKRLGHGEASPLPDYSPDSLDDTRRDLEAWRQEILGSEPEADLDAVREITRKIPASTPSARFAAETALLDLLGQARDEPLHRLLGGGDRRLPVATVLDVDPDAVEATSVAAGRLLGSGLRHLKVKIGRPHRFEDELRLLILLRRLHGDGWQLRLDANGSLPAGEVAERLEALSRCAPEWVEEPVAWPELQGLEGSPVPLAADECLRGGWSRVAPWLESGPCAAVVLKPAVLGGALECLDLARRAGEIGLVAVASHLFDGPVALQATAALAVALDGASTGPTLAHGVARHAALGAFPPTRGLLVNGPLIVPAKARPGLGLVL